MDSNLMRMILLGVGVVVVIGIYLWSRRRSGGNQDIFAGSGHGDALVGGGKGGDDFAWDDPSVTVGPVRIIRRGVPEPEPETEPAPLPGVGTGERAGGFESELEDEDEAFQPKPRPEPVPAPRPVVEPPPRPVRPEPAREALREATRQPEPPPAPHPEPKRPEPPRPAPPRPEAKRPEPKRSEPARAKPAAKRDEGEEMIISVHVTAPEGLRFAARPVMRAIADSGLVYGEYDIFHRYLDDADQPLFSVANMVKPGHFDADNPRSFETRGLTLFTRLPGPVDGVKAFDEMFATAKRLAGELKGEIRDQSRSMMSKQTVEHIHDQIREFQLRRQFKNRLQ